VGSLLVAVLGAGLATLDVIELGGPLEARPVPLALAATAVWLTGAWLAATAIRRQHWAAVAGLGVLAVTLGLLLVALHGFGPDQGWPASGHDLGSTILAALTGTFILVLAVGATALMIHMEPASLLMARWRWHRAQAAYQAAAETERADTEAAAIARHAWLGLVRARVAVVAAADESLARATVDLATVLIESSRPKLPPPL
jgi:hypothetical protein